MSIQEHLNKIRNAVYGHEVRESIAKGIETAYDDASEKDNANMEVKIARGTHPNLRSRLEEVDNKQQQNTAQLQQTATKTALEVERQRINQFTSLTEGSTTGDAELLDAHIGADGIVYKNIGESIRGQFSNVPIGNLDVVNNLVTYGQLKQEITTPSTWKFDIRELDLSVGKYFISFYDCMLPTTGFLAVGSSSVDEDLVRRTKTNGTHVFVLEEPKKVYIRMQVSSETPADVGTYTTRFSVYRDSEEYPVIPKLFTGLDKTENILNVLALENKQKLDKIYSKNLFDKNASGVLDNYYVRYNGKIITNEYTAAYFVSDFIPVEENTYYSISPNMTTNIGIAFYDIEGKLIKHYQYDQVGGSEGLLSPDKAAICRFTGHVSEKNRTMLEKNEVSTEYESYTEYKPLDDLKTRVENIENVSESRYKSKFDSVSATALHDGESITITTPDLKQNNRIGFYGKLGSFVSVKISHGETAPYASGYVVVDATKVAVYSFTTVAKLEEEINHELTFTDFISIEIYVKDNLNAELIVTTGNGGVFTKMIAWNGSRDVVKASVSGVGLENCGLTFYSGDYSKEVWAFGDSYFDFYPQLLNRLGANNWLVDGWSGRGSISAYNSLLLCLNHGTPKYILWCLGMNDADSADTINNNWETTVSNLRTICLEKGITLILTTTPNVPERNHTYKNEYVKTSGLRYVDVSNAVGADVTTNWYTGMLSGDNVHPTDIGSQAIAHRLLVDVPEIMD